MLLLSFLRRFFRRHADRGGIQFAASRGYNIVPTSKLQQYVKGIDLKSAVEDNVAFKLSFGVTFMLAAFAHF